MFGRKTIGFAIFVFVFTGGALFYEFVYQKKQLDDSNRRLNYFTVRSEDVSQIEITRTYERLVLEKKDQMWLLRQPFIDIADTEKIEAFLKFAKTAHAESVVRKAEVNEWAIYGLKDPLGSVTLRGDDGVSERVEVGSVEAVGGMRYYRRNQESLVLLGSSELEYFIGRRLDEWRSHKIFRKEITSVVEIVLAYVQEAKKLSFNKEGQTWVHSEIADIDQKPVKDLLQGLGSMQASHIVADNKTDIDAQENFNIKLYYAEISVRFDDGTRWVLRIGRPRDNYYYLTVSDRQPVFKIAKTKIDQMLFNEKDLKK
jgi:hypothetical protein